MPLKTGVSSAHPDRLPFRRWEAPALWLLLSATILPWFIVLTPPLNTPDESGHFWRAYALSEGKFINVKSGSECGDWLPRSLFDYAAAVLENLRLDPRDRMTWARFKSTAAIKLNPDDRMFIDFSYQALFSPLVYLPQAAAILAGRIFSAPPWILMYLGRLSNYLAFVFLIFLALRLLPMLKWPALLIAAMPMTVQLATSMSSDAMTIALVFLFVAATLRAMTGTGLLPPRAQAVISLLAVLTAAGKFRYLPLVGLILLIPRRRFPSPRAHLLFLALTIAGAVLLTWAWESAVAPISVIRSDAQIAHLLAHPLDVLSKMARSWGNFSAGYLRTLVGSFGWMVTTVPLWAAVFFVLVVLAASAFSRYPQGMLNIRNRGLVAALALLNAVFIQVLIYITWNKPENDLIHGVQGRYFIPLLLTLLLVFPVRPVNQIPEISVGGERSERRALAGRLALLGFCAAYTIGGYALILKQFYLP